MTGGCWIVDPKTGEKTPGGPAAEAPQKKPKAKAKPKAKE